MDEDEQNSQDAKSDGCLILHGAPQMVTEAI
jgi:hypothetical protein